MWIPEEKWIFPLISFASVILISITSSALQVYVGK